MSVLTINIILLLSKHVFIYISYLLPKDLFIIYMRQAMCLPWHTCGYQRTICKDRTHVVLLTATFPPAKPFPASSPILLELCSVYQPVIIEDCQSIMMEIWEVCKLWPIELRQALQKQYYFFAILQKNTILGKKSYERQKKKPLYFFRFPKTSVITEL